jgi:hypothetical protein
MSTKLDPGRYRARILYHTMTVNTAGNPEMRIAVLPYAGADTPALPPGYKPTPITIFMTITPATMGTAQDPGWVLQTLKHLGFQSQDLGDLDPAADTAHSFTGREIIILGSEDVYKNKKRVRWNIIRNQSESQPLAHHALTALSDKYREALQTLLPSPDQNAEKPPF